MAQVVLTGKQAAFVAAFVDNELAGGNLSGTAIAVKAGVNPRSAGAYASEVLKRPNVLQAIAERRTELAKQSRALSAAGVDAERVLQEWADIAVGDPTSVVKLRRVNCRHCWGVGHCYQYTDAEYTKETAEALNDATGAGDLSRFTGGPGFRVNGKPNDACPECAGEGIEDVHIRDFRTLTKSQRRLIAGVKQGRYGVEVLFRNQDEALMNLARFLGLVVNKNEHAGPNGGPIPTANVNYSLPADPVEAAKVYQRLMEGKQS